MTNSRRKGSAFEREVAKELFRETGINFKRDLDQYREKDRGDLIPDDDAWPFTIECKRFGSVKSPQGKWISQVFAAAETTGKHPCLIWKLDRQGIQCRIWFDAFAEGVGGSAVSTQHMDMPIQGLAYIAREIMARRTR